MIEKLREFIRHELFIIKLLNKSIRCLSKNRVCGIMIKEEDALIKGNLKYKSRNMKEKDR